ncbi:MAG TPA: L,D-transpeptidase family protein [Flavisolibacter sp.]|jgi:murein L,D-transpeptidase YcbB/YkuD|nr:L,D-transpeptidase family protein [Flavisolibacter sp.]
MKTFFIYAALAASLLSSCQNANTSDPSNVEEEEKKAEEKKGMSKRDYSITQANSYSDLFLDSAAMEKYIGNKQLDETVARRLRSFYNSRNFGFAWFTSNGLTEQARAFWNLHDYVTTYDKDTSLRDKSLQKKMDAYTAEEVLSASASGDFIQTELTLTQHFIKYILNNYEKGYIKRKEMERFIPYKKQDALAMADSLLNKKHKDNKYFEDVHEPYRLLKGNLAKYYEVTKAGGWPQIPTAKSLKKGNTSPAVVLIKKRLQLTGEMPGTDTSQLYNDTLENAVRIFQRELGYTPNGVVNAQLIKDLNVPAEKRLSQILMNMDRMRWMPTEPAGQLIVVNIPEFVLHVYEDKKKAFDMNVVVGKEGNNTISFSGDLSTVVFSPYWNVPPSIVKSEILPKIASNSNYLAEQNMEQVGTEGDLPKIRQLPGEGNSLGKVKFLFPNSFNIYFHDTPAKSLFAKDKRAYSHGCIRLAEPEKMAQYLLRNDPEWTPDKIAEAMNGGEEKYVKLKKAIPVIITYYTAWVNEEGLLNFRDDIYNHDEDLLRKMFL